MKRKYININSTNVFDEQRASEDNTLHFFAANQAATGHKSYGPSWEAEMSTATQNSWTHGIQIALHRHSKRSQAPSLLPPVLLEEPHAASSPLSPPLGLDGVDGDKWRERWQ
ncbi:hypothetical protein E2C01_067769 [Portunus trituberculatus]|uniref:Uncharacterized protein n=1 Tax=Portunus trituberculatus TaxID=210409 RepID=A0A5B7HLX7_PORTR|nr:hypothetical protein [Portunus trituberculatus]